jgi:hypothetical protein
MMVCWKNRGKRDGDFLPKADRRPIARTTSKTEASFYSRASCGSNAGLCKERGREVIARCRGNGRHEGHAKGEILSVHRRRMVSWIGGAYPGVHAVERGALAHRDYSATCARGQHYAGA